MTHGASDVERYSYCALSWWRSVHGHRGIDEATRAGVEQHARLGGLLADVQRALGREKDWAQIALNIGLFGASAAVLAAELVWLDVTRGVGLALLIISLAWTLLSLASLLRSLLARRRAEDIGAQAGLVTDPVAYSDLDRPGDLLVSKRFDLAGKPDYVVRRHGGLVPIEVKTGRTPAAPHESHVLQMGAYCLLVEEAMGERPPAGIIQYPDARFEIAYTEDLRDRVLGVLLKMRVAEFAGGVHRTHENPGKCRGCSRREGCPERLA